MRLVQLAHNHVSEVVNQGDFCLDATVGNGHDSLFLAQQVGISGKVFSIDIQAQAIQNTQILLQQNGLDAVVQLILGSHSNLLELVDKSVHGQIKASTFNLGYLPGGDHSVITQADNTTQAICQAYQITASGGIISVLCYRGHAGGTKEANSVAELCENRRWSYETIQGSENPTSPVLILIRKT
jgi:tRNA G37 N-methylase Trm5